MSTEIAPLQAIQNKIRDRIRSEFVSLIPDDAWEAMVQSVIADFTKPVKGHYQNDPMKPSPMAQMIRDEINVIAKEKVMAEIHKLGSAHWDAFGAATANEAVIKLVTDNFPALLVSMQNGMMNMLVMNAVNAIRNGRT